MRVDVLQVEDELCQVLDRVDIVMGRRRDQGDARNGVACLCDHVVHLEARQLSAFTRLGTLGDLDLYFVGIHQVFGCHAETSRSHLLDGGAEREAVFAGGEAGGVFTTFPGVAAAVYLIHRHCHCLVRLFADRAEAHGTCDETLHDFAGRFHLVERDGLAAAESQEVAEEDRGFLVVDQVCVFFKLLVAAQAGRELQGGDRFRVPGVLLAVFAVAVDAFVFEYRVHRVAEGLMVEGDRVGGDFLQADTAYAAGRPAEVGVH